MKNIRGTLRVLAVGIIVSFVAYFFLIRAWVLETSSQNMLTLTGEKNAAVKLSQRSSAPQKVIPSSTPTLPFLSNEGVSPISQLPLWAPDIQWREAEPSMRATRDPNGKVPIGTLVTGVSRTGTGISPISIVPHDTRIHNELTNQGWQNTSTADGPSGRSYFYTKTEQGKQRVIYLEYETRAAVISESSEPIRFAACPCPYELTIFYSDLF
jgi:hypothetical protein